MFKKFNLAAVIAAAASMGSAFTAMGSPPPAPPATGYAGGGHRGGRHVGKPGQAGDKLARMAAEGRIGRGGVR